MRIPIVFFGILVFVGRVIASSSDASASYHLYHKLGNGSEFTFRGTIKIAPPEEGNGLVATLHPDKSAQLDTSAFDNMVERNALYTLAVLEGGNKPPSLSSNSRLKTHHVSASVPGCSLRRSNLREEIGLSVGPTGKLLSVSYRPIISPLAPKTCQKLMTLSERPDVVFGRRTENEESSSAMPFKTTVSFDSHQPMMTIPTVLPQQRPPPGLKWYRRNSKNNPNPLIGGSNVKHEGGGIPGVDDEPPSGFKSSFLYRYWYIILPLAIMGLFGGIDEESLEEQQARQQRGAAGVSAGAVATGGTTEARQRRGKRD